MSDAPRPEPSSDERNWAVFCHLASFLGYLIPFANIAGPLVIWLVKRETSPFIDHHGREAVNFQISVTAYAFVSAILIFVLIGFALLAVLVLFEIVCTVIAAVSASRGERYTYPLTFRLIS